MLLTDDQIAGVLRRAGFTGSNLITATAVSLAESGGNTDAQGDLSLRDSQWGPSIGLMQIRSLNAQRGTGNVRDEVANYDPTVNAEHAYVISGGGGNFGPWSTFTSGAFRKYLTRGQAAASHLGITAVLPNIPFISGGAGGTSSSTPGLSGGAGGSLFDAFYRVAIFGTLAIGGIALVVLGGWRSVSGATRAATGDQNSNATGVAVAQAAKLAAV